MSVFTSQVTRTLDQIPGAPGQSVVIRKLPRRHLEAAAKESQRASIADVKEIGVSLVKELRSLNDEDIKKVAKAKQADPLIGFERSELVARGVMSWTLDVELPKDEDARRALVADLDGGVEEYLATEVLRLSRPKLFLTEEQQETEAKNV